MNIARSCLWKALQTTTARHSITPITPFTKIPQNFIHASITRNPAINQLIGHPARLFATIKSVKPAEEDIETVEEPTDDGSSKKPKGVEEYDPKDRSKLISWETSARYLKSDAYKNTYGNDPVWKSYRRQHKGQIPKPYTRRTCIRSGRISIGSPCPGCRDEYLVFDYRNTELLKQFISPFTGERLNLHEIGLCARKRQRLDIELDKAKYFGTMVFKVPIRQYNYQDYYGKPLANIDNESESQ